MRRAIVSSGSGRSRNRGYAGGPSFTTSNSMCYGRCVSKCAGSCWQRARNTRFGNGSARFLRSVRSGPPYCLVFCRPRTVSAASGSCGPTANLASRHKAAPITVGSTDSNDTKKGPHGPGPFVWSQVRVFQGLSIVRDAFPSVLPLTASSPLGCYFLAALTVGPACLEAARVFPLVLVSAQAFRQVPVLAPEPDVEPEPEPVRAAP